MFANLKFGDLHDQIESYDIIMSAAYVYSHFSLVAAGLQKMETYEVDNCVHSHHLCLPYSRCKRFEVSI